MEKILQDIGGIILDIGCFALEHWKRGNFKVEMVPHRTHRRMDVKAIDNEITKRLIDQLSSLGLTNRFLTEEGMDNTNYDKRGGARWVVDELDGTLNFATGELDWGHSIALEKDGEIIYAALYAPVRGELLLASAKEAYFLNTYGIEPTEAEAIRALPLKTEESHYHLPQRGMTENPLERIRCYIHPGRLRNYELSPENPINRLYAAISNPACTFSCTTALIKTVLGKLDAAVLGFQNYWDFAAGRLIIEKAGGYFSAFPLADNLDAPWPKMFLGNNDFSQAYADEQGKEWRRHFIAAGEKEVFDALINFMTS